MIPVKGGLKYFPVKSFYIQGEAGASFVTNKNDFGFNNNTVFVYAAQVGVLFDLGGKNYIDAGFRFEGNTKFTGGGSKALRCVKPDKRNREILILFFGLGQSPKQSLEYIAERFNITKEHAGRLKAKALDQLRNCSHAPGLRSCLS